MAIEVVFEKRINNAAAVYRDVDVEQRRRFYLLTSLAVIFGLGVLLYGWQHYRWMQLGYEIEILQKKKDDLLNYQKDLIVERENKTQFERIDRIARTELGMTLPAPGQIVPVYLDSPMKEPGSDPAAMPLSAEVK